MPRLLFEKTGNAVWISHLDLMRVFQRAFKRAGLPLKHTQGFNPRPSVSIALPLSVGIESRCELLDFELDGCEAAFDDIKARLNRALISGVRVLEAYADGRKIRDLGLLRCSITLQYCHSISDNDIKAIEELFAKEALIVPKKTKSGMQDQDIISMIRSITVCTAGESAIVLDALMCCQNPTLNPMQLPAAVGIYLPQLKPDLCKCCRVEIYDREETIFR